MQDYYQHLKLGPPLRISDVGFKQGTYFKVLCGWIRTLRLQHTPQNRLRHKMFDKDQEIASSESVKIQSFQCSSSSKRSANLVQTSPLALEDTHVRNISLYTSGLSIQGTNLTEAKQNRPR